MVEIEQALNVYIQLSNVKLERFPNGSHDSHKKYSFQFIKLVHDHLSDKNIKYNKKPNLNMVEVYKKVDKHVG